MSLNETSTQAALFPCEGPGYDNETMKCWPGFNSSGCELSPSGGPGNDEMVGREMVERRREDPHGLLARQLTMYCVPPVVLLGTVGNLLCMVVLKRKPMQTMPSSLYLIALAASDTVILHSSAFKTWIRLVSGFELLHVSDVICRLLKYTFFTATHFSAWLVVLLSVERFLVVRFPFRASSGLLARRPVLMIVCLLTTILLVNVNVLWASTLHVTDSGSKRCVIYSSSQNVLCQFFPKMNLMIYSIVPTGIIGLLNGWTLAIVLQSLSSANLGAILRRRMAGSASGAGRAQRQLTSTLLTISISWLLLSSPYSILENLPGIRTSLLPRVVCYLLMYLNHALNFYIYCLTGRKFRNELRRVLGRKSVPGRTKYTGQAHHKAILKSTKTKSTRKENKANLYN